LSLFELGCGGEFLVGIAASIGAVASAIAGALNLLERLRPGWFRRSQRKQYDEIMCELRAALALAEGLSGISDRLLAVCQARASISDLGGLVGETRAGVEFLADVLKFNEDGSHDALVQMLAAKITPRVLSVQQYMRIGFRSPVFVGPGSDFWKEKVQPGLREIGGSIKTIRPVVSDGELPDPAKLENQLRVCYEAVESLRAHVESFEDEVAAELFLLKDGTKDEAA